MITRRRFLAICGAAGGAAAAVAGGVLLLPGGEPSGEGLPAIRYGAEACAGCGMVIDDPRFAAAWAARGQARHYDDIGCLVNDLIKRPAPEGARLFVHDMQTEAWLAAADATYVISPAIRTPMAYGVAAAATREGADGLARQYHARVQAWAALASGPVKGRG